MSVRKQLSQSETGQERGVGLAEDLRLWSGGSPLSEVRGILSSLGAGSFNRQVLRSFRLSRYECIFQLFSEMLLQKSLFCLSSEEHRKCCLLLLEGEAGTAAYARQAWCAFLYFLSVKR